jgi:15-cis-phytoene synthase
MTALAVDGTDVRAAYRHCEQVTRTQARNFSYGIRLLPAPKRRALSAVYAFARRDAARRREARRAGRSAGRDRRD